MAAADPHAEKIRDEPDATDVRLMLAVRAGDAFAFEELLGRNQGRVFSLLFHLVGDRTLAEDLTQEVFLKVYRARETYEPTAKFSTWLYRIVHNLGLNALRTKTRRPMQFFDGGAAHADGAFAESLPAKSGLMPTRQLDRQEMQEVVRMAMASLPERQRTALLLHRFEGMSYEQMGDVLDLSPSAVKSLLCRARIALRDLLAPYIEEGRLPR